MKNPKPIVVHVISGLGDGGAESVLFRLVMSSKSFDHVVISMTDGGKYSELLSSYGVVVHSLQMTPGKLRLRGIVLLFKLIRKYRPSVVQTWMYHADLIGGVVARLSGVRAVYWNVRNSDPDCLSESFFSKYIPKACAVLSRRIPNAIVFCGERAAHNHQRIGYCSARSVIIGNGYDLGHFCVQSGQAQLEFQDKPFENNIPIIGMVARFNPQKDHQNLFSALAILRESGEQFYCVLVGSGMEEDGPGYRSLSVNHLMDNVFFLGPRDDIVNVMNRLDLHVLSSRSEGFPNVLAEAMACGTPCVATDAGDAAKIVGETGWIVPVKDGGALADAIKSALQEIRTDGQAWSIRKRGCRKRVETLFSVAAMVGEYEQLWRYGVSD